jgi:amino acid adenylation domain-containing protein
MGDLSESIAMHPTQSQAMTAQSIWSTHDFRPFEKTEVDTSIPDRFEQQVRQSPNRVAIKTKHQQLTYAELNQAANRVAHAIMDKRGSGDEPIALLFAQDVAVLVAMLGVLKAGKCYVPLDPSHPQPRLMSLLEHSQAGLILTNARHLPLAQSLAHAALDVLDTDALDARESPANLGLSFAADGLACLLYTSGSTGQPKGVLQSHRTILHRVWSETNHLGICPDDRAVMLNPFTFSASLRVIFSTLLNGAALYPFSIREDGLSNLGGWLVQEGIMLYYSTPTIFRYFTSFLTAEERLPAMRMLHLASEAATRRDVDLYRQHFLPHCSLVHSLSSGETGALCVYLVDHHRPITDNVLPVGYAVEDKEIFLLDERGAAVGCNQIGEIIVKSHYLSPGYWGQPELTRTAFQSDPMGGGARLYRTGDLGLLRPDGCLVHLGRKDFQVKIRGLRVNVAEMETVLLDHPALKDAVVVTRKQDSEEQELVAYVVPAVHPAPAVSTLRHFVQERLPEYMLPAAFVLLDALPRTHTGKVDRPALLAADQVPLHQERPFAAPRTPIEAALAAIWAEVLGRKRLSIHDHFLEVGGHSLRATQIASRVSDAFRLEIPLGELLQASTIAEMTLVVLRYQTERMTSEELDRLWAEVEGPTEVTG